MGCITAHHTGLQRHERSKTGRPPLATGATGRRQQRRNLGPGLVGEFVAADHVISHIEKLAAGRTYNSRSESFERLPQTT